MATNNQGATLKKGVASLLGSEEFSDMTITVKDNKVFKVHKNIISSQSKFFYNACTKDFKEKKEANIDLSEQDPEAVEAVLEYLYKCDYTRLTRDNVNALVIHVHVYQLANMYYIQELKDVAAALFKKAAEKDWELPAFPLAIQEIYINPEGDDKTLRKLAVEQSMDNLEDLLQDDDGEFAQTMTAFGEFGKDLCRASLTYVGPRGKRGMVDFSCVNNDDYSWRICLRKTSESFKQNLKCPQCASTMAKQEQLFASVWHNYKCTDCDGTVGTANLSSCNCTLYCPFCDQRTVFRKF